MNQVVSAMVPKDVILWTADIALVWSTYGLIANAVQHFIVTSVMLAFILSVLVSTTRQEEFFFHQHLGVERETDKMHQILKNSCFLNLFFKLSLSPFLIIFLLVNSIYSK